MKEVIYIGEELKKKPVQFTHTFHSNVGWIDTDDKPSDFEKVVYLGKCQSDGDMFCAYDDGYINIYKGNLNSGKY